MRASGASNTRISRRGPRLGVLRAWCVALLALGAAHPLSAVDLPAAWSTAFPVNTANGPIAGIAVVGTTLWAGGSFTAVGTVLANGVATWNGTAWSPAGAGFNGPVTGLVADASGNVSVCGNFTASGSTPIGGVARWNGSAWTALGSGFSGGSGGTHLDHMVAGPVGTLVVSGSFTSAGGVSASDIALWSGGSWHALGSGLSAPPAAIAIDSGGNVYAPDPAAGTIQRFSGGTWTVEPRITGDSGVTAIGIDSIGNFWAAASTGQVWELSAGTWNAIGSGPGDPSNPVTSLFIGAANTVTVTCGLGTFSLAGTAWSLDDDTLLSDQPTLVTVDASNNLYRVGLVQNTLGSTTISQGTISIFNSGSSAWSEAGPGLDEGINALATDSSGDVFLGGVASSDGVPQLPFAVFELRAGALSPLGAGLPAVVQALSNTASGVLYAGLAQATSALFMWNGSSWAAVGGGLSGDVLTLASDPSSRLFIGGTALASGSTSLGNVVEWNGSLFVTLGAGLNQAPAELACDGHGNVFAVGTFTASGTTALAGFAEWNGSAWTAPSTGSITPRAIASDGAGDVLGTDGTAVIKWNGSAWSTIATTGPGVGVRCLAGNAAGALVAGGAFGGGVAVFTIGLWETHGSGTDRPVVALALFGANVVAVGAFSIAGGVPSGVLGEAPAAGGGTSASGSASGTGASGGSGTQGGTTAGESTTFGSNPQHPCGLGGGLGMALALGLVASVCGRRMRRGR